MVVFWISEASTVCNRPEVKRWMVPSCHECFCCFYWMAISDYLNVKLGGGFKDVFFTPTWGNDPIWLIFFRWVETTNQETFFLLLYVTCFLTIWEVYLIFSSHESKCKFGKYIPVSPLPGCHKIIRKYSLTAAWNTWQLSLFYLRHHAISTAPV